MSDSLVTIAVGVGAGVLSGAFGVGGGIVTTPAIRLLLGYPELIAVGTPLVVILPTALAGAVTHVRNRNADVRTGLAVGLFGVPASVAGALLSTVIGGRAVLIITAGFVIIAAIDMLRPARPVSETAIRDLPTGLGLLAGIGLVTGVYSGLLGLGGGFVLVPLLRRFTSLTAKGAIGTSLVAVGLLAIPGSITHWMIGNVDIPLALALSLGVVPGAILGARLTLLASDRHVRVAFAVFLAVVGLILGISEAGVL